MPYDPRTVDRSGDYMMQGAMTFGHGIGSGLQAIGNAIGRVREEQKTRAREFDALVNYMDATGMMPKDAAKTRSLEELKGIMQGQVYNEETQRRQQASDLVAQQITEGKRRLEMADRNQRFNAMMGDFLKRPQFAGTVAGAPVMRPPQMDPSQMLRMAAESGAATPDMVSDSLRMQAADRRQRLLDSGEMLQEHEVGGRKFVVNRFTGQMVPLDAPADLDKRANPTGSAKLSTLRQLRADAVRELSTPGLMRDPKARAATQKRIDEIDDQIAVLLSGPGAATGGPGDVDRDPLGLFK